jgi:hypothetical protein
MLSSRKIFRLYIIATLASGFCLLFFKALPAILFGEGGQGPVLIAIGCISYSILYGIINLVFFIPLNNWIFRILSVKGSIVLFLFPSIAMLLFLLTKGDFELAGDPFIILITVLVNTLCICVGSYFIFTNSEKEKELT